MTTSPLFHLSLRAIYVQQLTIGTLFFDERDATFHFDTSEGPFASSNPPTPYIPMQYMPLHGIKVRINQVNRPLRVCQ